MISWNKYFDKIICLSLVDNISRREKLVKEFERVGIDVNAPYFEWKITVDNAFYPFIWTNPNLRSLSWWIIPSYKGSLNCTMGHYEILKECKVLGYEKVLILEDDICFLKDLDRIEQILDAAPEYELCLYDKWPHPAKDHDEIMKAYNDRCRHERINNEYIDFQGMHMQSCACYALSKSAIDKLIRIYEYEYVPADVATNIVNCNKVCSCTNIAIQNISDKDAIKEYEKHLYDGVLEKSDYNL